MLKPSSFSESSFRPFPLKKVISCLFIGVAFLFCGSAISSPFGCSSNQNLNVSSPCTGGEKCTVKLTLLHTSDIHSRLFPYELKMAQTDADLGLGTVDTVANVGGVARMSYVLGRERARADRVLHLDSGDCFQGAPIHNFFKGEPETRSLSAMGVDAAVVGNHEFDSGAINVGRQFQKWATFSALAANYKWDNPAFPNYALLATVARPFKVFNQLGLKVAVIGMANLSSLTSLFELPNKQSVVPLNTAEIAQFYIDLLRPSVDVIVMLTHLGLEVDQDMIHNTTGIDVVLGGHNHVVINPSQELRDCSSDPEHPGFVWTPNPNIEVNFDKEPPDDEDTALKGEKGELDPVNHPWQFKRPCTPRKVILTHSGAFAKYVGRLDLLLSNSPDEASPNGRPSDYDKVNGFEVISNEYRAIPIRSELPSDPVLSFLLEPYQRAMDFTADLQILAGYSPSGSARISNSGGDSPLGNLIASAMWLRLGVETDFSLTNSPGIRADLLPGPVTVEQMYNIFPFDNAITKMQLSGLEVLQLFDFAARRAASRGCTSQIQVAGARLRVNCNSCSRSCEVDSDCPYHGRCDVGLHSCYVPCDPTQGSNVEACPNNASCGDDGRCSEKACAEAVYIGHTNKDCTSDQNCVAGSKTNTGQCDLTVKKCMEKVQLTNRYELATSDYLSSGGSGYRVLQRNTTQFNTRIQQRDALLDYMRQGKPCGYSDSYETNEGLKACESDADCGHDGVYVCACSGNSEYTPHSTCQTNKSCAPESGRCVLSACRDSLAVFHDKSCAKNPDRDACRVALSACSLGGEECKYLSCIDHNLGNFSDGRIEMIGR